MLRVTHTRCRELRSDDNAEWNSYHSKMPECIDSSTAALRLDYHGAEQSRSVQECAGPLTPVFPAAYCFNLILDGKLPHKGQHYAEPFEDMSSVLEFYPRGRDGA